MPDDFHDPYPSRKAPQSRIMARHEPVIASPQRPGPLPPPRLLQYQQDGYLRVADVFGADETARLDVAVAQLRTCDHVLSSAETVRAEGSADVHAIYRPHAFSEVLGDVVHDARLVAIAKQILGTDCYIHHARVTYPSAAPRGGRLFRSDFETWHVDDGMARMHTVSIVLGISDASRGPLRVIPGSHRQFVSCSATRTADSTRPATVDAAMIEQLTGTHGVVVPELPRGAVMVVDCNLMQAVESTVAHAPKTLTVVYNSVDNMLRTPYSGRGPRPAYLAERHVVPM